MEIQMDEIIHTNSAATAPTTFTACFLKNQLTLWLRKAAHALSFGTLIPLTSEEESGCNCRVQSVKLENDLVTACYEF